VQVCIFLQLPIPQPIEILLFILNYLHYVCMYVVQYEQKLASDQETIALGECNLAPMGEL
jgi:hypothetical protein